MYMKQQNKSMITDEQILALRERNEIRLKEAKEKLGDKWLLHPSKQVVKKTQ
jgi:hypothetical protein